MRLENHKLSANKPCYVIAEIGHNHQGDESIAMKLIQAASESGADAVKFQKRSNSDLFTKAFYNSEYSNSNSFGKTYGEHREFLEPKKEWLQKANHFAHSLKLDFIMTVFDLESLEFCNRYLSVDAYKIQSADLTYTHLIEKVIKTGKPYFISCGASSLSEIKNTFQLCSSHGSDFCLMYAVSSYPCADEQLNLKRINRLQKELNYYKIGYSCHSSENKAAEYARICGVVALEKHFTLDRSQKGPDHHFSSSPFQMKQLIKGLSEIDKMGGKDWQNENNIEDYQMGARYKMGKSAVANCNLDAGSVLDEKHIRYQSPSMGLNPFTIKAYIGKSIKISIEKDEFILPGHF